jgi:hypothetical protein
VIEGVLRGKIDVGHLEDALTSTAFGLMRYLPHGVLVDWLATSRGLDGLPLALPTDAATAHVELWPYWPDTYLGKGHVEPDALVRVGTMVLVFEAKLGSGKSSEEDATPAKRSGDQLARQWKAAIDRFASETPPSALVYVTAEVALPRDELEESARCLLDRGIAHSMVWTSWGDLARVVLGRLPTATGVEAVVLDDLFRYLTRALAGSGMPFRGWSARLLADAAVGPRWAYAASAAPRTGYWGSIEVGPTETWSYRAGPVDTLHEGEGRRP